MSRVLHNFVSAVSVSCFLFMIFAWMNILSTQ